jgi:hypothetical protein
MAASELQTFVASPMKVMRRSSSAFPGGACSVIVNTSHSTCVGWL